METREEEADDEDWSVVVVTRKQVMSVTARRVVEGSSVSREFTVATSTLLPLFEIRALHSGPSMTYSRRQG